MAKTSRLTFRISGSQKARLQKRADKRGVTLSALVSSILTDVVAKAKKNKQRRERRRS